MFPVIGLVIVVAAIASGAWFMIPVGCLIAGFGILLLFLVPILRTAFVLSLDERNQTLSWQATMAHGEVPLREVSSVVRSSRPGVWEFRRIAGQAIPFWLDRRNQVVQDFFARIAKSYPQIDLSDLYGESRFWWRKLPSS
jgi:hypothetical protein